MNMGIGESHVDPKKEKVTYVFLPHQAAWRKRQTEPLHCAFLFHI